MKISNRNIKMRQSQQIIGIICGVILFTSIFITGSNYNSEKEEIASATLKVNQQNINNRFFLDWRLTIPYNCLSVLITEEESEPTDERLGEETGKSNLLLHKPPFYNDFFKSMFINFNLSFQRRIRIPFFLLHHSWKIHLSYLLFTITE